MEEENERLMPRDPCPPGPRMRKNDKVVKTDNFGNLSFGRILDSGLDGELTAVWDDGSKDDLSSLVHADPPKVAVYDRPLVIGSRVKHSGKEGQVCRLEPIVTGYLAGHEPLHVFALMREHMLHPILESTVGQTVICNGWVGVITDGMVDVTYKFDTGRQVTYVTLKSKLADVVKCQMYPRMPVGNMPYDVLKKGSWSSGISLVNSLSYRNKDSTIHRIQLSLLNIDWYDRIGANNENSKPPSVISGKEYISKLFGFNENSSLEEKFAPNSLWTVRYDENLLENFLNWRDDFVDEVILKKEKMEDVEPFFKRAKKGPNISSLSRVAIKILFFQTEVEILFDDGSVLTALSKDLLDPVPSEAYSCPIQDRRYLLGEVVKDRTDFIHLDKYGFIFSQNFRRRTALVKWINVRKDGSVLVQKPKETSLYDILPLYKYSLLKNTPQIVVAKERFEGIVKSVRLIDGQVEVQCAEGPVKLFWAHELEFCKKKAFCSPNTGWVPRDIPLPVDVMPLALNSTKNAFSAKLKRITAPIPRKFLNAGSPENNYWTMMSASSPPEDLEPTSLLALSQDLEKCLTRSPSIFVETFSPRKDIFTIVFVPASDTIYRDVPFFLDCKITKDYPSPSAIPRVIVRLPRVDDPSWIHPAIGSDGQLSLPEELKTRRKPDGLGPVARALKYIIDNIFENVEPFLGLTESAVKKEENDNNNEVVLPSSILESSRSYNEAAIVVLTEYIHALLCNPPVAWKSWIENYFKENLFRMSWRYIKYMEALEDVHGESILALNRRKNTNFLLYPVSESFRLALRSRVDNLSNFIELSPPPSTDNLSG